MPGLPMLIVQGHGQLHGEPSSQLAQLCHRCPIPFHLLTSSSCSQSDCIETTKREPSAIGKVQIEPTIGSQRLGRMIAVQVERRRRLIAAGHHGMEDQELIQTQNTLQWHTDGLHQLATPPVGAHDRRCTRRRHCRARHQHA